MHPLRVVIPLLALLVTCSPDEGKQVPSVDADPPLAAWPDPLPAHAEDAPFLHKGLVVGSWAGDEADGFDQEWVDEQGLRVAFTKQTAGRRSWTGFASSDATIPADSLLDDRSGPRIGYIYSLISRTAEDGVFADQPAVLHVRHRGRVRIRVDGVVVVDEPAPPDGEWRDVRAAVTLTDPYDVVLAKLGSGSAGLGVSMGLQIRVSAPDGSSIPGQAWNTMRPPGQPTDL